MDVSAANRRVYIIDDLLGAILLLAAAALAVLLDLTRRQICAVYQLAFALCAACTFFIVGGLVDHHLSNEQLNLALYGSYLSGPLTTSYIYLPILASVGVSIAFIFSLSACNCDCCCLAGASATSHQRCLAAKLRANTSLYGGCIAWLLVAIGTRLNVRLRESAINPVGGTVHWMMLRSPFFLTMAHLGSLLLVALKLFLQHADRVPGPHFSSPRPSMTETLSHSDNVHSSPSMVDELMRPPPIKSFALAPRRTSEGKLSLPRSPQAAAAITIKSDLTPSPRATIKQRRYSGNNNSSEPLQNDGDVSSLISSDSDSDDSVLRPSLRTSSTTAKAQPPRHASVQRTRPSGYASSPPPSPTHSTTSTGSSSTHSSTRPPRASVSRPSSSSGASTRPRLTSSASSSSTTFLSDNDDQLLSSLEAYGSYSGNEGVSYLSDQPQQTRGIRRRAPSLSTSSTPARRRPTPVHTPSTEWMACVDEATGSAYYYNTATGESRWKEQ